MSTYIENSLDDLHRKIRLIHAMLEKLLAERTDRDWYDIDEAALVLGLDPWTLRNYCRLGRVHADKKRSGRGRHKSWIISRAEIQRVQREGLLPFKRLG